MYLIRDIDSKLGMRCVMTSTAFNWKDEEPQVFSKLTSNQQIIVWEHNPEYKHTF